MAKIDRKVNLIVENAVLIKLLKMAVSLIDGTIDEGWYDVSQNERQKMHDTIRKVINHDFHNEWLADHDKAMNSTIQAFEAENARLKTENASLRRAAERDADVLESLSGQLEDAQAENERLRKEIETERLENGGARKLLDRIAPKCGTKDCPSLVAYVEQLEDMNTKFIAQIREMWDLVNHRTTYGYVATAEHMEELGIEVAE